MTNATARHLMGKQVHLHWFKPAEFNRGGQNWYPMISPYLLVLLDVARTMHGRPVYVSGHNRAVGRFDGRNNDSQHNFDRWDEVRGIDLFFEGSGEPGAVEFIADMLDEIGFTGIGLYPQWRNNQGEIRPGFHVDVRSDRRPGDPATWGYLNGEFVTLADAIEWCED